MSDIKQRAVHAPKANKHGLLASLGRKKPVESALAEPSGRTLRWYDLMAYGIAATVGSGIFAVCGKVARDTAGPAVVLSTLGAGLLGLLTGIVYLEFASALPVSGCGYAYCYTALGEFMAWLVGWNLTLEYTFAASAIACSWTDYLGKLVENALGSAAAASLGKLTDIPLGEEGGFFRINLIAPALCILVGLVVSRGVAMGARLTNSITALNLGIIVLIIAAGMSQVKTANWTPFMPFQIAGVFRGTGTMFFSYIGYDTIASLAGEAVNPVRDLPIAVIGTIAVATVLYMLVGLAVTGMVPYASLDKSAPLAEAFKTAGMNWAAYTIAAGALLTMLATTFACILGQPKILQAIANDGLLPRGFFARENRAGSPVGGVFATAALAAATALFIRADSDVFFDIVAFGTLFGMCVICAGLLVVRFGQHSAAKRPGVAATLVYFAGTFATSLAYVYAPEEHRLLATALAAGLTMLPALAVMIVLFVRHGAALGSISDAFSCPLMPVFPCIAILANVFVMCTMSDLAHVVGGFLMWTAIGVVVYFAYGLRNSRLAHPFDSAIDAKERQSPLVQ